MTRRQFLFAGSAAALQGAPAEERLTVPVTQIMDSEIKWTQRQLRFHSGLWGEAVRDLSRCGVQLDATHSTGAVSRPPYREPVISGLKRGTLNFVITRQIPMQWSAGRAICGVTTNYRGHHLCMIALNRAHGHQVPFLSVNTYLHELLHALLGDIFERRPRGVTGEARELRIDYHATRLWLLRGDGTVRAATGRYVARLRV